jgi:CheY-like chemotaxis protein
MDHYIQQRIFEPFFTTKDQGKGTGLGLSVVYGVVNSHNGFIHVQSEPGKGSRFSLYFPLLTDRESIRRATRRHRLLRGSENVLVVDDEESVSDVIGGMLRDLGYTVTLAHSGQQALALYAKRKRFDLVVLDVNMPEMSGRETLFKLKEIDPNVRVIISTGYGTKSMESLPLHEVVDGFLEKPYQLEELSKAVRAVLDRK